MNVTKLKICSSNVEFLGEHLYVWRKKYSYGKKCLISKYLSSLMRKPTICICENKDADQLRGNREADQCLCFRYRDSTIPLFSKFIQNFQPLTIFCDCTAWFVSDLVGTQIVGFLTHRLILFWHLLQLRTGSYLNR